MKSHSSSAAQSISESLFCSIPESLLMSPYFKLKTDLWKLRMFCFTSITKAAVRNVFWLNMMRNQYLSKYITSQCSKLSPYFSPIHNGKLSCYEWYG